MTHERDTLRARVQAEYPDIDERLLQEIAGAEILATAKSVYAAGNNKFPRWTPERWFAVLTFAMAVLTTLFLLGGDWRGMKEDVSKMAAKVDDISAKQSENEQKLDDLKAQIETIERADEWYRNNPRTPPQFGRQ